MAGSGSVIRVSGSAHQLASTRLSSVLVFLFYHAALVTSSLTYSTQCLNEPAGRLQESRSGVCPVPGRIGIVEEGDGNAMSWSFPPKCINQVSLDNSSRIDCLFTSTEFRNGHGTSLVTTTPSASHLIGLEAFSDKPAPLVAQRRDSLGPSYDIVPVEGKGQGVVANRLIRRGEIIMVDVPAVLVSIPFLADTKPHHRRRIIKQAINQLPEETRRRVYSLSRGSSKYEVDAIMGSNSNTITVGEDEVHVGLFTEAAVRRAPGEG